MSALPVAQDIADDPARCVIEGERHADRVIDLVKADIAAPDLFYVTAAEVHAAFGSAGLRGFMRALQKRAERRGRGAVNHDPA